MKFGPVVQEMSFKEKVNGRTDGCTTDGRQTKTDHNSSPQAFCSGELKRVRRQQQKHDK